MQYTQHCLCDVSRPTACCSCSDFWYEFFPGERIGVVGPNGAGKSTMLNLISGNVPLTSGERELGETTAMGFFEQEPPTDLPQDMSMAAYLRYELSLIPDTWQECTLLCSDWTYLPCDLTQESALLSRNRAFVVISCQYAFEGDRCIQVHGPGHSLHNREVRGLHGHPHHCARACWVPQE